MHFFTTGRDGRTMGPLLAVPNVSCVLYNAVVVVRQWFIRSKQLVVAPEERTQTNTRENRTCNRVSV